MNKRLVVSVLIAVGITVFAMNYYYQKKLSDQISDDLKTATTEYVSPDLNIKFNYPKNLTLSFIPTPLEDEQNKRNISTIVVDKLLYIRKADEHERYMQNELQGYEKSDLENGDLVKDIIVNGKEIRFSKYTFGDGVPAQNCLWSDLNVSYIAEIKESNVFVEIKTEEGTSCDGKQEYTYRTDLQRVVDMLDTIASIKKV